MSFPLYTPDLLSTIISFLDNNSSVRLISTCQYIKNHGDNNGFLTTLKLTNTTDTMEFYNNFSKHEKSLKTLILIRIDDPFIWIPKYVERLIFENCSISCYINPGKRIYTTKVLKLKDYDRCKNKSKIRINWSCFPNLEEIELYVHDIDLNGLDKLDNLKTILIDTCEIIDLSHIIDI